MSPAPDGAALPAMPPPPGQVSNFEHPPTLAHSLLVLAVVFLLLMIISVVLRVYVRLAIVRSWWWDDAFIVLAAVATSADIAVVLWGTRLGFGAHTWDVRVDALTPSVVAHFSAPGIIFPLAMLFLKTSIALLYHRLFSAINRSFRIALYAILAFCTVFYLAYFGVQIHATLACSDWQTAESLRICRDNSSTVRVLTGTVNVLTDLYLIILPIPVVMALQMGTRRKMAIIALVAAGAAAFAVSVARLAYIIATLNDLDRLYTAARVAQMSIVEETVGVVAACLITLPKLSMSPICQWLQAKSEARADSGQSARCSPATASRTCCCSGPSSPPPALKAGDEHGAFWWAGAIEAQTLRCSPQLPVGDFGFKFDAQSVCSDYSGQ